MPETNPKSPPTRYAPMPPTLTWHRTRPPENVDAGVRAQLKDLLRRGSSWQPSALRTKAGWTRAVGRSPCLGGTAHRLAG